MIPSSSLLRVREIILIGVCATALRALVFICVSIRHDITIEQWAYRDDGKSYIAYAQAILGDPSQLTEYDTRVFPGFPAMIAAAHLIGLPLHIAAVGIPWLSAGLAASFAAMLFRDRRVGWGMVMLIPHWLTNSSLAMSEASMLALILAGSLIARLVAASKARTVCGSVLLGTAGLVRPMACFAVAGWLFAKILQKQWRFAFLGGAIAAVVVITGTVLMQMWTGDAFRGVRVYANAPNTYAGQLLTWPFASLVQTPLRYDVSTGRIIYIWSHVAVTLLACVISMTICTKNRLHIDPRDALSCPWLVGNTLFVLCIGSYWGFQHFPRFTIPALPAMLWVLRFVLPKRWVWWAVIAGGSLVISVMSVMHDFVTPR